jgi:hypothetical protein
MVVNPLADDEQERKSLDMGRKCHRRSASRPISFSPPDSLSESLHLPDRAQSLIQKAVKGLAAVQSTIC